MQSTTLCLELSPLFFKGLGTLRTEALFVFLNKEEMRRLCVNPVKLLKSPQPKLLDESILFSLIEQVYSSASIR